jgi:hypothetical protein
MKKEIVIILVLLCAMTAPLLSQAEDYDGSTPLLCTVIEVNECIMGNGCKVVTPEEINLPRFLWVDVSKKTIQSKKSIDNARKSKIEMVKEVDHKLIIQGAEQGREDVRDGFGWTIAIMEDTGNMVLTASGDLVGNVAFGVCTPY